MELQDNITTNGNCWPPEQPQGCLPAVRVRIERDARGTHRVFCQRAKYKHWFELGAHRDTDLAFYRSLRDGSVTFAPKIIEHGTLFDL